MIHDLWIRLKNTEKPILLYGMGNGAELVISRLKKENKEVSGVFASDDFVRGQKFLGHTVITYGEATKKFGDFIVLTAFGTSRSEVMENIKKIATENELYIPDLPVYGNTVFDKYYFEDNKEQLCRISEKFADERSKFVFENIVNFKLSGNPQLLFNAVDAEDEIFENLVKLKCGSNIFDLGAYNGDTAQKFAKLWPECGKIIAVEPDAKNFSKLCENTNGIQNITAINAAIGYLDGKVMFSGEGGRNQSVNFGKVNTEITTIDSLRERICVPDFIKFDIEGEELNALIGAEKTIKTYKPILMISAYHRSEDIVSIPQKVLSLNPEYKMYIRHFDCIPCWDTYYIFV